MEQTRETTMMLVLAIAFAGVIDRTPTKVCTDACGVRVGCLAPEAAIEGMPLGERPAHCPPPAPKLIVAPFPPPPPPDPYKTVCIDDIEYFEATLTPKYFYIAGEVIIKNCR